MEPTSRIFIVTAQVDVYVSHSGTFQGAKRNTIFQGREGKRAYKKFDARSWTSHLSF